MAPPFCGQTDTTENITFAQLRWREIKRHDKIITADDFHLIMVVNNIYDKFLT